MEGKRRALVMTASLVSLLVVLGLMFVPNRLVTAEDDTCSCGGRLFEDPGNPYTCGECTWYVSFMREDIPDDERWGDAGGWDDVASAHTDPNFSVGDIPYERAIAVYEGWLADVYPPGHVAYVESAQGDNFTVSEMNWAGQCFNEGRVDIKQDGISFIYPPSDTPVPLWPYSGLKVEYRDGDYADAITLQWYGDAEYYDLWLEVQKKDADGNPIGERHLFAVVFDIARESYNLYDVESPEDLLYLVCGTWYWRIGDVLSGVWSEWATFELENCIGIMVESPSGKSRLDVLTNQR